MNTWYSVGVLIAVASLAIAEPAKVDVVKAQTTCPVMGGAVNRKVYADYEGQRIYFCCKGCPEAFKKDPGKFMKKFKDEGIVLEKIPVAAEKK